MKILLLLCFISMGFAATASSEITPYKFSQEEYEKEIPPYDIPPSSRFIVPRTKDTPDIIYYLSGPSVSSYPIAIVCSGSTSRDSITSVIHIHRYFLAEFLGLGAAVLTIEQWGVNGNLSDTNEFMQHYTRTQRLNDHKNVIDHLRSSPPASWNGKFILLGVSEGGPLVTTLARLYTDCTIATINWSGAGDWSWRDELWAFIRADPVLREEISSKELYNARMDETLGEPTPHKEFLGMTYKYHADALTYPPNSYEKLRGPFLVVSGALDSLIDSYDAFVEKAKAAGANITYYRIEDMDHYVRKRPDIIKQSFEWLKIVL